MKLNDLTDIDTLESLVNNSIVSMIGNLPRDTNRLGELQKELNERVKSGELSGHENGAAFIVAVRDAIKKIPSLPSVPSDNDALNMAVLLIDLKLKYERPVQTAGVQQGV